MILFPVISLWNCVRFDIFLATVLYASLMLSPSQNLFFFKKYFCYSLFAKIWCWMSLFAKKRIWFYAISYWNSRLPVFYVLWSQYFCGEHLLVLFGVFQQQQNVTYEVSIWHVMKYNVVRFLFFVYSVFLLCILTMDEYDILSLRFIILSVVLLYTSCSTRSSRIFWEVLSFNKCMSAFADCLQKFYRGWFTEDHNLVLSQFYKGLFRSLPVFTSRSVTDNNFMTSLRKHNSYSMQ